MQALAAAALSGCGLALVMPCAVSIIADLYEERVRGRAFGSVLIFGSLGARRACEAVSCSAIRLKKPQHHSSSTAPAHSQQPARAGRCKRYRCLSCLPSRTWQFLEMCWPSLGIVLAWPALWKILLGTD